MLAKWLKSRLLLFVLSGPELCCVFCVFLGGFGCDCVVACVWIFAVADFVAKALELFMDRIIKAVADETKARGARRVTPSHL